MGGCVGGCVGGVVAAVAVAAAAEGGVAVSLENWFVDHRLDQARVALSKTELALSRYEDSIAESTQLYRRLAGVTEAHQLMAQMQGLVEARRELSERIGIMDVEHRSLSDAYHEQLKGLHKVAGHVLDGLVNVLGCGLLGFGVWTLVPYALVSGVRAPGSGFLPGSQRETETKRER